MPVIDSFGLSHFTLKFISPLNQTYLLNSADWVSAILEAFQFYMVYLHYQISSEHMEVPILNLVSRIFF